MKPLLFPCLLAAAIFLAPAQELPALKWTNRDQQSLMRGAWWNACLLYTSPSPRD